jgi:hypothetical protein
MFVLGKEALLAKLAGDTPQTRKQGTGCHICCSERDKNLGCILYVSCYLEHRATLTWHIVDKKAIIGNDFKVRAAKHLVGLKHEEAALRAQIVVVGRWCREYYQFAMLLRRPHYSGYKLKDAADCPNS